MPPQRWSPTAQWSSPAGPPGEADCGCPASQWERGLGWTSSGPGPWALGCGWWSLVEEPEERK